ncbi:hypothetical protein J6590_035394 [Homalodisca vitripennis]|nr:hypothetical protein J6590_035394 [Homalodisca vitripennis]
MSFDSSQAELSISVDQRRPAGRRLTGIVMNCSPRPGLDPVATFIYCHTVPLTAYRLPLTADRLLCPSTASTLHHSGTRGIRRGTGRHNHHS